MDINEIKIGQKVRAYLENNKQIEGVIIDVRDNSWYGEKPCEEQFYTVNLMPIGENNLSEEENEFYCEVSIKKIELIN